MNSDKSQTAQCDQGIEINMVQQSFQQVCFHQDTSRRPSASFLVFQAPPPKTNYQITKRNNSTQPHTHTDMYP